MVFLGAQKCNKTSQAIHQRRQPTTYPMQTRARETPAPIPPLADTTRKELPMPLIKSRSKEAFKENIKKEVAAGKPVKQAVAIAYFEKREVGKK